MQSLQTLTTPWWQPALNRTGSAVEGIAEIEQSIALILSIAFGSVPFAPTYYSDLQSYIDRPVAVAAPKLAAEAIDALRSHEPRITVERVAIASTTVPGRITFSVVWQLKNSPATNPRTSQISI